MAFGDASNMMSSTSLYAFLVYIIKHKIINADFGGLVGVNIVKPYDYKNATDIAGLKSIFDALKSNCPALWNNLAVLRFHILDYFLWHISKAYITNLN